ncbi:hypothetical protein D3C75_855290 [compost metagenome]
MKDTAGCAVSFLLYRFVYSPETRQMHPAMIKWKKADNEGCCCGRSFAILNILQIQSIEEENTYDPNPLFFPPDLRLSACGPAAHRLWRTGSGDGTCPFGRAYSCTFAIACRLCRAVAGSRACGRVNYLRADRASAGGDQSATPFGGHDQQCAGGPAAVRDQRSGYPV